MVLVTSGVVLGLLVLGTSGSAGMHGQLAPWPGADPTRTSVKHGRPLDGSDPEMKRYFSSIPGGDCGNELQLNRYHRRESAHRKFVEGGDRLALYLIRQYQASVAEGYVDSARFLNYAAHTTSETAFSFITRLLEEARQRRDRVNLLNALRALRWTEQPAAIDIALAILATEEDSVVRTDAIEVVRRTVDFTEAHRPDAIEMLHAIEWDESELHPVRRAAWAALNRLARYGLVPDRRPHHDFGEPPHLPKRLIELSRQLEKQVPADDPDRAEAGCVRYLIHCGLVE
jgi:hypothetical protein